MCKPGGLPGPIPVPGWCVQVFDGYGYGYSQKYLWVTHADHYRLVALTQTNF